MTNLTNLTMVVDPGGEIGWVLAEVDDSPGGFQIRDWGETPNDQASRDDWFTMLWQMLSEGRLMHLVIEGYKMTTSVKSSQMQVIEQIGVLKWMGYRFGVPVDIQYASDKKFATPAKLAPYRTGKDRLSQVGKGSQYKDHAISALSHLIRWRFHTYERRHR